jgi:hypothetical protein
MQLVAEHAVEKDVHIKKNERKAALLEYVLQNYNITSEEYTYLSSMEGGSS